MDTRQLAAFSAVVERRSFSEAAERLGISQPAVSQQIRSLEERVGQTLIDRSGRRVEPTEAGWRLYRGAQRMLAAEEQLLAELSAGDAELRGRLSVGASTGPGGRLVPLLLAEFAALHPGVEPALRISDTQTVIERVADRELELGVVGAARKVRGLEFDSLTRDEIVLAVPAGHAFAGTTVEAGDLAGETLVEMQDGAGVRQVVERELRRRSLRIEPARRLELGLQESVKSAVAAGHGVGFISRTAIEDELRRGAIGEAGVAGIEPARDLYLVRSAGRIPTGAAEAFVAFARERAPAYK